MQFKFRSLRNNGITLTDQHIKKITMYVGTVG